MKNCFAIVKNCVKLKSSYVSLFCSYVGSNHMLHLASSRDIHLRGGCFCNVGACLSMLKVNPELLKNAYIVSATTNNTRLSRLLKKCKSICKLIF